jgi:hypothetical protein
LQDKLKISSRGYRDFLGWTHRNQKGKRQEHYQRECS